MAQQGIQGGEVRPEPKFEDRESSSAMFMESQGAARARNEAAANKPVTQQIRDTTNRIKDYVAEKMDNASAATKTTFISGDETSAQRSSDSIQG